MTKIIHLAPHDPIPDGPGRRVLVLRRFDEDAPREIRITITLTGAMPGDPDEVTRPLHPDGAPLSYEEAISAAERVADSEKIGTVFVIDRLEGRREQDILRHGGDHSVHGERLDDFDWEDGERGSDMRDRTV